MNESGLTGGKLHLSSDCSSLPLSASLTRNIQNNYQRAEKFMTQRSTEAVMGPSLDTREFHA